MLSGFQTRPKNWYKIETQLPPDDIRRFSRLERATNMRAKVLEGLKWGRLYGGAAAVIVIDGHDDLLDAPLELDMVMPGSFKGLIVLDRWSGIVPSLSLVMDTGDPDFGLPEFYTIASEALGSGIRLHHSRVVRFMGRDLPYIEKIGEQYWGASEIEHVYEELKKRDNTSWNIATLIFSANLKVYKMEGMDQIALMPEKVQRDLYNTMTALNIMMNSSGMQIIGKNDEFNTHQYSFSGLSDVYELFMLDVAGAAETPVTKLFGRSPAGMNATGESDMQNYYDAIEEKQESYLRPVVDKLLPVMCMSEFGAVPDDLNYSFVNCRRPTEEQKKNLAKQVAEAVVQVYSGGIISHRTALMELKASSELTGMWASITDDDIDKADDGFNPGGEMSLADGLLDGIYGSSMQDSICTWDEEEKPCRAKDPSKCPVHGTETVEKNNNKENNNVTEKPLKLKRINGKINITGNVKVQLGGKSYLLVKDSTITSIKTFAGKGTKTPIRKSATLTELYGDNAGEWQKTRGNGLVDVNGSQKKVELHWFENNAVGVVEMRIKRWMDNES